MAKGNREIYNIPCTIEEQNLQGYTSLIFLGKNNSHKNIGKRE